MVFDHDDFSLGKLVAQGQMKAGFLRLRERPHHGDAFHIVTRRSRETQALVDGGARKAARTPRPVQLGFFHGGFQLALVEDGASGVAQQTS